MALQVVLTLPQQRLHYLPRLLPIPPTYKLNGSSFGRPDVDLMFAKWAFNNVTRTLGRAATMTFWGTLERLWRVPLPRVLLCMSLLSDPTLCPYAVK